MTPFRKYVLPSILIALVSAGIGLTRANSLEEHLPKNARATQIIIQKSQHKLLLMSGKSVLKTYIVALGRGGPGPKVKEGDKKVPEGLYRISGRKLDSHFHYALKISYPEKKRY